MQFLIYCYKKKLTRLSKKKPKRRKRNLVIEKNKYCSFHSAKTFYTISISATNVLVQMKYISQFYKRDLCLQNSTKTTNCVQCVCTTIVNYMKLWKQNWPMTQKTSWHDGDSLNKKNNDRKKSNYIHKLHYITLYYKFSFFYNKGVRVNEIHCRNKFNYFLLIYLIPPKSVEIKFI